MVGNRKIIPGSLAAALMQHLHVDSDDRAHFVEGANEIQLRCETLREALLKLAPSVDMSSFHSLREDIDTAILDVADYCRDADSIDWRALDSEDIIARSAEFQERRHKLHGRIHALIGRADDIESDLLERKRAQDAERSVAVPKTKKRRRRSIGSKPPKFPSRDDREAWQLKERGWNYRKIADEVGCVVATAHDRVQRVEQYLKHSGATRQSIRTNVSLDARGSDAGAAKPK